MKIQYIVLISFALICLSCNQDNKKYDATIGVSMLSLQNEFVVNLKDALIEAAKEKNIRLIITDAQRSAEKQVQQVESFISQKVDCIILNPCEVEASSPAVEKAKAAGIPIINVNSETRAEPNAFVGSRDEQSGEIAMEYIAQKLNGKGNVLIMDGYMGQAAQIKRTAGAKNVLSKYPGMKVLAEQTAEWDRAKAMTLMENWIQSFGNDINAVFAQNDEMGMGALQALEQSGLKNKVLLVSIDAIEDALEAVKTGRMDATVYQDAKGQASGAIETAFNIIKKLPVKETKVYVPFKLVTKENAGDFIK